jgi:predicted ATPase
MSQQVANWIVTPAGEHTNRRSSHFHNRCSAVNGCNVGHAVLSIASGHYYAELGQFEDAWRCFGEAMTPVEKIKERWSEAKINRAVGELRAGCGKARCHESKAYFELALAVARQQQAKSWELRAAMSLARLWRDQGKSQLRTTCSRRFNGWFTEGFNTRNLIEAKTLLEELAT